MTAIRADIDVIESNLGGFSDDADAAYNGGVVVFIC